MPVQSLPVHGNFLGFLELTALVMLLPWNEWAVPEDQHLGGSKAGVGKDGICVASMPCHSLIILGEKC